MTSRLLTLVLSACISVLGTAQEVVAQATRDLSPHRVGAVHRDGARSHFLEADAPALGKYTISTLVGDLHALLDSLRIDRVALVGHSISGAVAAKFSVQCPSSMIEAASVDDDRGWSPKMCDWNNVAGGTGDSGVYGRN